MDEETKGFANVLEIPINDASYSWNGFTYQGKVAIYTTLYYINHYIDVDSIPRFKLELEHMEDFSILKDDEYFSLHQVKAKPKDKTIGLYNEANMDLLGKLAQLPSIKEVNLHTATKINTYTQEDLRNNLERFDVSKKKAALKIHKKAVFEYDNFDKLYDKLKTSKDTGIVPFERWVSIEDIKNKIIEEIEIYYKNLADKTYFNQYCSEENKEFIYSNFIRLIDEKVMKQHLKKNEEGKILIDFLDFISILKGKNVFDINFKTASSILINEIVEQYHFYCFDYGIESESESNEILKLHINGLKEFDPEEFLLLCRKLTPNILVQKMELINISTFRKLMQPDNIRNIFLHSIVTFAKFIVLSNQAENAYIIKVNGSEYTLTTITGEGPSIHLRIGEEIYKNLSSDNEMLSMLYEIDNYVTKNINNDFHGSITNLRSITNLDLNAVSDRESKEGNNITSAKKIKFISIDALVEEI